jgi:hypothetical protein
MRFLAPGLAYLVSCVVFWGCFAEDAFIVARYAANLVEGHGLVYNPGERINALTSPAHVFVLAPLQAATGRAIEPYALLMAIAVGVTFWRGAPRIFGDSTRQAWFLGCALAFPAFAFWTIGGLETPLVALAAFGVLAAWSARGLGAEQRARWVLVACGAAVAARYDAVLLVMPAALFVLHAHRRSPRVWMTAFAVGLALLGWLAFCQAYYGDYLPTSFYVKNPAATSLPDLARGAGYEASFLVLLLLPIAAGRIFAAETLPPEEAPLPRWPIAAGVALLFAYGLSAGIKHMMYAYRLFVPCVPWLVFLVLARARSLSRRTGLWAALALQVAMTLLIHHRSLNFNLTVPFVPQSSLDEIYEFSTVGARYSRIADRVFAAHAADLRAHWARHGSPGEKPRLVSITAGQPPYELREFHVLDLLAGYRKRCTFDLQEAAHYRQFIAWLAEDGREIAAPPPAPWQPVVRTDIAMREWSGRRGTLRIAWYYRGDPRPNRLPPSVDAPCRPMPT